MIGSIIDFLFHLDKHLSVIVQHYGAWTYLMLFGVIFAETGFVVTPFLPGDSLLFVVGAFSANNIFNPLFVGLTLIFAAVAGDSLNYAVGKYLGNRMIQAKRFRLIKKEHLDKTHAFFEKYGSKTIVLARFVPIVRTFAPFVAGLGRMSYAKFFIYNVTGGILWVVIFVAGGFYFGNIPAVKEHLSVVVLIIVVVSVLPVVYHLIQAKTAGRRKADRA